MIKGLIIIIILALIGAAIWYFFIYNGSVEEMANQAQTSIDQYTDKAACLKACLEQFCIGGDCDIKEDVIECQKSCEENYD